jgi:Protein of unknown function (DUF2581).
VTPSPTIPDSHDAAVFRSRFNAIAAVVVWSLCAVASAAAVVYAERDLVAYLTPLALVAFGAWMVLWNPSIAVDDDAVHLVNVTKTIEIPWPAVIQIDTRYALTVQTPNRRYSAAAAPAPGRLTIARGGSDTGHLKLDGPARPGDSPKTDSGAAAWLVRDRWNRLVEAGRIELGVAESTPVLVRWHAASIAVCGALFAASVLALALS